MTDELKQMEARALAAELAVAELLASARPNPKEHPTMWKAWENAQKLNLTAAREVMRKANTYVKPAIFHDCEQVVCDLRRLLAEQTALVERCQSALRQIQEWLMETGQVVDDGITHHLFIKSNNLTVDALALTPAAALDDYRDEVLEEVAKLADARARKHLPPNPENDTHWTPRNDFEQLAAKIRAMKGGGK